MLEDYGLHELVWDTCDQVFPGVFVASPADAEGRGISLSVLEGGEVCDLTGARVYLAWRHELTHKRGTCEFSAVDAAAGNFELYYPEAMQGAEGEIAAQIVVSIGDDRAVSSRVFWIRCEKVVVGGEECADGFSLFIEAIKAFEKASTITYAAADEANAAASAANTAASEADAVKDEILADKAAGLFDGADGKDGKDGADGAQGPVGPKGDKGDKGDTGVQGPKGDTGATGATGPKGDVGETGATGPQGEKGDTGPKGDKGDTGDAGPQGNQGLRGPKGDTGATGAAGADGLAATIAVGTVTTGSTASVVNVGTANAAIFNFVFPNAQGGSGMSVKQIQCFSKTGSSRAYLKGSLPVCLVKPAFRF